MASPVLFPCQSLFHPLWRCLSSFAPPSPGGANFRPSSFTVLFPLFIFSSRRVDASHVELSRSTRFLWLFFSWLFDCVDPLHKKIAPLPSLFPSPPFLLVSIAVPDSPVPTSRRKYLRGFPAMSFSLPLPPALLHFPHATPHLLFFKSAAAFQSRRVPPVFTLTEALFPFRSLSPSPPF